MMKNIAVYCASSSQIRPEFFAATKRFGELLAENDKTLVWGAGNMGLMGEVADAVIGNGGKMIGVIPEFMVDNNWHHPHCTELITVPSMSERKQTIERISDAMVVLPGGIGTMDELFEILVDKQLGLHIKPIVILNTNHYYDLLIELLHHFVEERMMRDMHLTMFTVVTRPEEILPALENAPAWDSSAQKHAKI